MSGGKADHRLQVNVNSPDFGSWLPQNVMHKAGHQDVGLFFP